MKTVVFKNNIYNNYIIITILLLNFIARVNSIVIPIEIIHLDEKLEMVLNKNCYLRFS